MLFIINLISTQIFYLCLFQVRQAYRKPKHHHRPPRPPQKPARYLILINVYYFNIKPLKLHFLILANSCQQMRNTLNVTNNGNILTANNYPTCFECSIYIVQYKYLSIPEVEYIDFWNAIAIEYNSL